MSQIVYNGVSLDFPFTRGLDSRPAWTPDNCDYLGTDHVLRVQGVVHGADGAAVAAEYDRIRHALEQPRKSLVYTNQGGVILESSAALDIANGPHPELVSLDRVVGTTSFHVSFTIRTRLWGCGKAPKYLSNRWTERHEILGDHTSRITRSGTLHVARNMFADSDATRGVVTPQIAKGFNRTAAEYEVQSDGLALSYRFVDEQVESQPPSPAIRVDLADYTEQSPSGSLRYAQVRIGLTGRPGGDRKALLATAIMMGVRRIQQAGGMRPGAPSAPVVFSLQEQLHKNKVQIMMMVLLLPSGGAATPGQSSTANFFGRLISDPAGVGVELGNRLADLFRSPDKKGAIASVPGPKPGDLDGFGLPLPGSDPDLAPDPTLRGTTPAVVLVAAALNDPCLARSAGITELRSGDTTMASAPTGGTSSAPTAAVPPARVSIVGVIIDAASAIAGGMLTSAALYSDYCITCRWDGDEQIAHMAPTDTEGVSAFVALAAPTKQLTVEYTAERIGAPPAIPPRDLGPNYVLLSSSQQPAQVDVGADGVTPVFRTAGWMVFGVRNPSKVTARGAIPPWVVDQLRGMRRAQSGGGAAEIERMLALGTAGAGGPEERGIFPWLT